MSDLSRLRARLLRIERRGRALKAEIEQERSDMDLFGGQLTRAQEKAILRLEGQLAADRKLWAETYAKMKAEEARLIADPAGFLRFT